MPARHPALRGHVGHGAAVVVVGALRVTRLLLRERRTLSSSEIVEVSLHAQELSRDAHGSSSLELNLLEDPTAGLASGPAEELSPTELETRVRVLVSSYAPSIYRLLYTPFIDVVGVLVREKLVPEGEDAKRTTTMTTSTSTTTASPTPSTSPASSGASASSFGGGVGVIATAAASPPDLVRSATVSTSYRPVRPEEMMSRWFTDGAATLKHPHETAEAMGKRRWTHFCRALEAYWAEMEAVMPLTRVVRHHHLREDLYVPLLRQLAMELADPTKRTAAVTTLPGFILSLANGRAPRSLGLPERDVDRIRLVSSLFMGVAQEAGDTDLAYLALQLLRANNMETPFAAQKQLTNVFAAASRIETDWQMRGASLLVGCYRKWLEYFREVQLDNKASLEQLAAVEASVGKTGDTAQEAETPNGEEKQVAPSSSSAAAVKRMKSKAGGNHPGSAKPQGTGTTRGEEVKAEKEESAEQYRYFTSRRQDDITRITALEENIEAAVRGRAAELQGLRVRRRKHRSGGQEKVAPVDSTDTVRTNTPLHGDEDPPRSSQETTEAVEEYTGEDAEDAHGSAEKSGASSSAKEKGADARRPLTTASPHRRRQLDATEERRGGTATSVKRSRKSAGAKKGTKAFEAAADESILSF
ncbi:hypothetical protein ABB37_06636 [Leptomonas pyrrhocoris]|uniref:Uncharacterized protein n=1 Tax=Leptomonas pyrrhocoris TaxID=157538 RepID=A0A0M9FX92_LEPPY|nr:hypothetical protein ABB37_06636 [Leptomonas pyrrhocoris]KPA77819.1 hypothetical protein ABB37_06636 [Leptomonas pyrrhocoris]|eukprot:XP_015656258.1 hypothetical protein ABB37_06636 [Leptomonas pyrrhocoris]